MDEGIDLGVDLVILDEAHYMSDPERGVVWEEVLIYLSHRVRIMLLSATIPNAVQLARWLAHIRGVPCAVVHSDVRPVPLHVLFRTPNGELTPFLHGRGLFPKVARFVASGRRRGKFTDTLMPDVNGIVETLREFNLLPAIMFLKSRADCDKALEQLHPSPQKPEEGGFAEAADGLLAPTRNYTANGRYDSYWNAVPGHIMQDNCLPGSWLSRDLWPRDTSKLYSQPLRWQPA